ncbi:TonB-dependent receptor domain-containing protein [Oceanobacter kriegii]|uniref:TonB-dependent receptor domain-containing protein n=1 Tax=Oceanobacter kriegii TaxID=64972 RepID=UPI0004268A87|nr:TonB-dependent receptor [Oceanobacter kriegii]
MTALKNQTLTKSRQLCFASNLLWQSCLFATLASPLLFSQTVHAEASQQTRFNIEAGALAPALNQFAQQAGVFISVDARLTRSKTTAGVQGSYSTRTALQELLNGSGLVYEFSGPKQITLSAEDSHGMITLPPVTVTAEKVKRSLQDTATAVTVVDGDAMQQAHYREINEVIEQVPNTIEHPFGVPSIRGVDGAGAAQGVFSFISGGRPRVSTVVDGLAETWTGQRYISTDVWDSEQVEVLRGPQSTTQGRNTMGGAVVMTTADPNWQPEAKLRAGYENQDAKYQLAGVVSGPLVEDQLAYRLAAEHLQGDSYIDYHIDDEETGDWSDDPGHSESTSLRGKLLWQPASIEQLSAKLTISHREAEGEYLNYINGPDYSDYDFDGDDNNTRLQDSNETSISLDLDYAINNDWSAKVLLGSQSYHSEFVQSPSTFYMDLDEDSVTLDARLVYEPMGSASNGMVGLYYYDRSEDIRIWDGGFEGTDDIDTWALYGEGNIAVTDTLSIIAGGRVEREHQVRDIVAWPGTSWQGIVDLDHAKTIYLPKLGVMYAANDHTSLSLTARKGYNAGGGALDWISSEFYTFDEERVTTFEASLRSSLWQQRLELNTTVFHNRFDGYLAYVMPRFTNLEEATSTGLELEIRAAVSESTLLSGSVGLLKTDITDAGEGYEELEGNEFGYAPKATASLGIQQQIGDDLSIAANAHYVSSYYSDASNDDDLKLDGYTTIAVNAQWQVIPQLSLSPYIKNLTNEEVVYRKTQYNQANVGGPRTIGLTVDLAY